MCSKKSRIGGGGWLSHIAAVAAGCTLHTAIVIVSLDFKLFSFAEDL